MANKPTTVKVAYDMDMQVKMTLAILKAELRAQGIAATETGIIEVLIESATLRSLARLYRKAFLGS